MHREISHSFFLNLIKFSTTIFIFGFVFFSHGNSALAATCTLTNAAGTWTWDGVNNVAQSGHGTATWTGCTSTPGSTPSTGDTISIGSGLILNITGTTTVGAITLVVPTVANGLTISDGATVTVTGALTFNANTGAVNETVTLQGTAILNVGGNLVMSNTPTSTGINQIVCDGTGTTAQVNVTGTTGITAAFTAVTGKNIVDLSLCTGATFSSTGLITITGNTFSLATSFPELKVGANSTITAGAGINIATNTNALLTAGAGSTINLIGALTVAGQASLAGITSTTQLKTTGTSSIASAITWPGTLNVFSGTTTLGNATITITGQTTISGALANVSGTAAKTFTGLVDVKSGGSVALTTGSSPVVNFAGGITTETGAGSVNFGTNTTTFTANQTIQGPVAVTLGGVTINSGVTVTQSVKNSATVTIASLTMAAPTAANGLSLTDSSTTSITGATTFTANVSTFNSTITMNGNAALTTNTLVMTGVPTSTGVNSVACGATGTGLFTINSTASITGNSTTTGVQGIDMSANTCSVTITGLLSLTGGTNATGVALLKMNTGALALNGGISFVTNPANGNLITTGADAISFKGSWSGAGTITVTNGSTLGVTGTSTISGSQVFPSNLPVTIGGSAVTSTTGNVVFNGSLTVSAGATLQLGNTTFTAGGSTDVFGTIRCPAAAGCSGLKTFTGSVTVENAGTFDLNVGAPSSAPTTSFGNNITLISGANAFHAGISTSTTVFTSNSTLSGSAAMTFEGSNTTINTGVVVTNSNTNGTGVTFGALTLATGASANGLTLATGITTNVTGALTFSANTSAVNETLTLQGTAILNVGGNLVMTNTPTSTGINQIVCDGTGTTAQVNVTGTTGISAAGTAVTGKHIVDLSSCSNPTFSSTGLITITGNTTSLATSFPELKVGTTGTITAGAGITFGSNTNARLTAGASAVINLTGALTVVGQASLTNINAATQLKTTGTSSIASAITWPGTLEVVTGTTSLGAVAITVTGTTNVDASATLQFGGTTFISSSSLTVAGTVQCTAAATCTNLKRFDGLVQVNSGGVFDMSVGTPTVFPTLEFRNGITMNGTTFNSGTLLSTFSATASQALAGASAMTFGGAVTVGSGVTLTNNNTGIVTVTGVLTLTGNWTQGASSKLYLSTASPFSGAGTFTASDTTPDNLVNYTAAAPTCKVVAYDALTFSGSGAVTCAMTSVSGALTYSTGSTMTHTLAAGGVSVGSLSIGSGVTLTSSSGTLTDGGDFTNNGTFTHNSGTVALSTSTTSNIGGSSSTTFNNFSVSGIGAAKTLNFKHHTTNVPLFTFAGTVTLTGASGQVITIDSDDGTNPWLAHFNSTQTASWVNVSRGGCDAGTANITGDANSVLGSGNGSCWNLVSVTLSGVIYTNDAASTPYTCATSGNLTVRVAVAGTLAGTPVACSADTGIFSITGLNYSAGQVLTIFIDSATSSSQGVVVTKAASASAISGMQVIKGRVVVRDENGVALTNSFMSGFDADTGTGGGNVPFTSNAGALSVTAGHELLVWTGKTFTPGGSVTTAAASTAANIDGDVVIQSGATLTMGTNALSVGGDYTNSGTLSVSSGQTTTFTATGTGFGITRGTGQFDAMTFNGSGGDWTLQDASSPTSDVTITSGTLKNGGFALTGASGKTFTVSNGATFEMSGSSVYPASFTTYTYGATSTVKYLQTTATVGAATYGNLTLGGTGTYTLPASDVTLRGNLVVTTGATVTKSSANKLIFAKGGGGTQTVTGNATNSDLGILQISANTGNSTLSLGSSIKATSMTVDASQTLNITGYTLTLSGNGTPLVNNGTFTASTTAGNGTVTGSTVEFASAATTGTTVPALHYYNLKINKSSNAFTAAAGTLLVDGNLDVAAGTLVLNTNNPATTIFGNVTIAGTLNAPSTGTLILGGDFTNNGTFTHDNGTVAIIPSAGVSTININGSANTSLYNFTVNDSSVANKNIAIKNGLTLSVSNNLTINGSSSNGNVILSSDTPGSQWTFYVDPAATVSLTNIVVKDSACGSGTKTFSASSTIQNAGNNGACWNFFSYKIVGISSEGASGGGGGQSGGGQSHHGGGGGSDCSEPTNASSTATLSGGGVASASVDSAGSCYTSAPTVLFCSGGGSGATGTATISSGLVTAINVTNAGSGYSSAPTVVISQPNGSGGGCPSSGGGQGGGGGGGGASAIDAFDSVDSSGFGWNWFVGFWNWLVG